MLCEALFECCSGISVVRVPVSSLSCFHCSRWGVDDATGVLVLVSVLSTLAGSREPFHADFVVPECEFRGAVWVCDGDGDG